MSISILKGDFTKEWRFFASADFGGVWRRNIRADCVQISSSPRAIEGVEIVALRLTSYRDGRLNRLIGRRVGRELPKPSMVADRGEQVRLSHYADRSNLA